MPGTFERFERLEKHDEPRVAVAAELLRRLQPAERRLRFVEMDLRIASSDAITKP
jgi:hypothetical protein